MSELNDFIAALDQNGDGVLSKDELKGFLSDGDFTEDEIEATIDSWIHVADSNGDGALDR